MSKRSIEDLQEKLDKADEHLDRAEYQQAEALANEVLLSATKRNGYEAQAHCILGKCCVIAMLYKEAEAHFEKASFYADATSDLSQRSNALDGKAYLQGSIFGDKRAAHHTAEQALEFAVKAQNRKEEAKALSRIGMNIDSTDNTLALEYHMRALVIAEELDDKIIIVEVLCRIGMGHSYNGDYQTALEYYSRALSIAENAKATSNVGYIQVNIGNVHYHLGDNLRALIFHQRALSLNEGTGNKHGITVTLCNIGNVYKNLADYGKALEYYFRGLKLIEETNSEIRVSLLSNIGSTYLSLSDYSRALEYLLLARTMADETGSKKVAAISLVNIGLTYFALSDYRRALEFAEKALHLSSETGNLKTVGFAMHGIAMAQSKLGNHSAAYHGFANTLQHRREVIRSNADITATLLNFGCALIAEERFLEGLAKLQEALQLANELGERAASSEAHKELANAYSKLGDIPKAFEHQSKYIALDKEILSEESKKKVEVFNIRQAIAEKEKEREIEKLRAEHSERELANSTLQLVAQTELLTELRDGLLQVVRKFPMPDGAAKELRDRLKTLPCKSVDWEKFDTQFKAAHPEFTKTLLEKYPALSTMEVRVSSLVRMNLKSDEIGRLLCLSERTIESHRYNLRKKMKLAKEDDLGHALARL
jgi:tetratricopeptide (TPR) repeat protein/DNA-binding CsgD family transcriptional regulator